MRINLLQKETGMSPSLAAFLLLLFSAGYLYVADYLIRQLIYNSSFSFTLNRINEITLQTALGIGSMMLLLFGFVLLMVRSAGEVRKVLNNGKSAIYSLAAILIPALLQFFIAGKTSWQIPLLYLLVITLSLFYSGRSSQKYGMSYLILFIVAITLYSIHIIYHSTEKRTGCPENHGCQPGFRA